jgi:hypothetical protein
MNAKVLQDVCDQLAKALMDIAEETGKIPESVSVDVRWPLGCNPIVSIDVRMPPEHVSATGLA